MVIVNQSSHVLTINGEKLSPEREMSVPEMAFSSQGVFSDAGSIEIITEYSKRKFNCYGQLTTYENQDFKDFNGLPYIMIVDRKGDNHE